MPDGVIDKNYYVEKMKSGKIISAAVIVLAFSCVKEVPDVADGTDTGIGVGQFSSVIDASCFVPGAVAEKPDAGVAAKSIVGQTAAGSFEANFVKLDESMSDWTETSTRDDYEMKPFTGWDNAETRILDATVFSADNTSGIHFRSVYFNPNQTYPYRSYDDPDNPTPDNNEDDIVVGFVTRMVGWYPRTCELQKDSEGIPADTKFIETDTFVEMDGKTCVLFENVLDGQTDVMMTDMREGRYDLRNYGLGFRNNTEDMDIQPYGHIFSNGMDDSDRYSYCNYFTFKHYLSGVRLFVQASGSDLSLIAWNRINEVVFKDQPATVAIALPENQNRGGGESILVPGATPTLPADGVEPVFGEPVAWDDYRDMPIIRTAMAEDDAEESFGMTAEYPIEMDHDVNMNTEYLGYMLVEPDRDAEIEIHTDAGVISMKIPVECSYTGPDGQSSEETILQAGYIYDIYINIRTDGTLDVVVGSEDTETFRNLAPYNEDIGASGDFEYANCYMITPDMFDITDETGVSTGRQYAGFYFQAETPGCGERGMVTGTVADLYPDGPVFEPYSARILWQDTQHLIRHVELLHGYVRFVLNEKCRTEGMTGNAVIAVYDRDGELLWTWHIWVTDRPDDISYNTGGGFSMMDRNLGAVFAPSSASDVNADNVLRTYGLYYQWGRKDPSPGPESYDYSQSNMRTKEYYYMDDGTRNFVSEYMTMNPTVETGAKYPLALLNPTTLGESYSYDWLYSSVDRLWGWNETSGEVVKTIYDPCPYGYRIPGDELAEMFKYCEENYVGGWRSNITYEEQQSGLGICIVNEDNDSGLSSGQIFHFFPYTGWKGQDRGMTDRSHAWLGVGSLGDYQDARICNDTGLSNVTPYYKHRGRSFLIQKSLADGGFRVTDFDGLENANYAPYYDKQLNSDYANRTSAAPVRCVRYDAEP